MTVSVPALPGPVPQSTDPLNFDARADATLGALPGVIAGMNAQNVENNALNAIVSAQASISTQASAAAVAAANFRGNWSALSGALSVPASVLHNGQIWLLTTNLANVSVAQPGSSGAWFPVVNVDAASRAPIQPSLDLDFANQRYRVLDGEMGLRAVALADVLTYTGAGRTYTGQRGGLLLQSNNAPRLEFDPVTGAGLGLSVWGARSNLLLNSLLNGTPLATQSVTLAAVEHRLSFYGTGTVTLSGLATGSVTGTGAYPSRSGMTFTPSGAGSVTITVSGSVQFAMLSPGNTDSPFIPTAGVAVTAAADVAQITGANLSKWFGAAEGTLVCVYRQPIDTASTLGFVALGSSSATNQISIRQQGGVQRLSITTAGNTETQLNGSALGVGATATAAICYAANAGAASFSGGAAQVDSTLNVPALDRMEVGNTGSGVSATAANTTIARIIYYPRALPGHLQALSA